MSTQDPIRCPNCGAVLPEGLEACSHCGATLEPPTETLEVEIEPAQASPPPSVPARPPYEPPAGTPAAEYPPVTPAPAPTVLPPVPAAPGIHVHRTFSATVNFQIPQKSVDKEGWLTPEQWQRLLDGYEAAIVAQIKSNLERGLPSAPATQLGVAIPWDQVGDQLTFAQRAEIERNLTTLLTVRMPDSPALMDLRQEMQSRALRPKVSVSCGSVLCLLGVVIVGVAALLAR